MARRGANEGQRPWAAATEFAPQRLPLGDLAVPHAPAVHLWYLDLGSLWQPLASVLGDETRQESGDQSGRPEDISMRELRFARRFYLRMLLGAYLGVAGKDVALIRGPRGKPILDRKRHPGEFHFSLSKSGQRLLVGISGDAEVGVDLELEDRKPRSAPDLARRFFTSAEARAICALDAAERDAAFMRTWACKEAVAKASGHGIANRFCRFSIEAPASKPPAVVEDEDHPAAGWQLALLTPEKGYVAAVAVPRPSLRVEAFRV